MEEQTNRRTFEPTGRQSAIVMCCECGVPNTGRTSIDLRTAGQQCAWEECRQRTATVCTDFM